ncbi:hypothetical protein TorRG33x02_190070 [Trema orientale]|uniref:Uncharacterized protein n=1 Tax=Trema orientale TaxID=63057 RepID=A0A2P5EI16_TREOI|nr:hypothetical protein TorRG33x02_190070 [Trema orientale]
MSDIDIPICGGNYFPEHIDQQPNGHIGDVFRVSVPNIGWRRRSLGQLDLADDGELPVGDVSPLALSTSTSAVTVAPGMGIGELLRVD